LLDVLCQPLLQAFGLIVRRINDEPFEQPSVPGSKAVTIRFIVPNPRMGSVIGKQGSKIKEIQEASGARLTAGEAMLPGSTERVLSISGVADAVHIAVYYVGTILLEHQDRNANNLPYRPAAGASRPVGGQPGFAQPFGYGASAATPLAGAGYGSVAAPGASPQLPPGSQTQQIFIPNDLVGCIIGKGGAKINEIRSMSASHIKIMEPGAGIAAGGSGSERLVTITGPPPNIQMAVSLLYQRLEQEKMRLAQGGAP
jgi:poly(rC)-binding protein 2/3/4